MTLAFIQATELCERSLRRLAENKGCYLTKRGDFYTIYNGDTVVTVDDEDCWSILNAM